MKRITISGEIGWDVKPNDVRKSLDEAKGSDIETHLASVGGFVYDGIEIYNLFSDYRRENPNSRMDLSLKGIVASMGSYIASNPAFDVVKAEDNAVYMIHNPYAMAIGDYRDMQKSMSTLEGITKLLASSYAVKSQKNNSEIRQLMDDESWFFGNEIKDSGFADEMIQSGDTLEREAACAKAQLKFKNLVEKMRKSEKSKSDLTEIAALLKPLDAISVMNKSVSHGKSLINAGKVDKNSSWSLSSDDENAMLGTNGDDWTNYALWHLAEDTSATEKTKARYKYAYGKNGKVYRSGVIAAKQRGAQQGEDAVANAADSLLQLIDKSKDEVEEKENLKNMIKDLISEELKLNNPANGGNNIEEETMDVQEIREKHPELYAEIIKAGREEELKRIAEVKAQSLPGHEKIIEQFIIDGKTTGDEAAKAILKIERENKEAALAAIEKGSPAPVPSAPAQESHASEDDSSKPIEERAKSKWDTSKEIRDEFKTYEVFLAYMKNYEAGNIRIKGGNE
jgi:ATP-dependent protease ClpP protease subunit